MTDVISGKRILVTGACGSVGAELVRQLLGREVEEPGEVIGLDNNESELFMIDQKYLGDTRARFFMSDIRDRDEMVRRMQGVDVVFHAAALKHVILCERSPEQAVQTNINGVQNVIAAAIENDVRRVIFTSSDKAVNPTNVMGTSKLMGERLMTAANSAKRGEFPIFASTRFGNVLGSRGSVLPVFRSQIAKGGPVTLTDAGMTRFVMSLEQAVRLVIDSVELAQGGEIFITKMPVMRIADLAAVMIRELAPQFGYQAEQIKVEQIGAKPGEKLFEELMNTEEVRRALELENYFSVPPAFRCIYNQVPYQYPGMVSDSVLDPYVSENQPCMSHDEIAGFLKQHRLLEAVGDDDQASRYWPGDKERILNDNPLD